MPGIVLGAWSIAVNKGPPHSGAYTEGLKMTAQMDPRYRMSRYLTVIHQVNKCLNDTQFYLPTLKKACLYDIQVQILNSQTP